MIKRFDKKENSGITLVALVITIIILLILAGITISQLSNNGLFGKTQEAKEKYQNAVADEETEIAKAANELDVYFNTRSNGFLSIDTTKRISVIWDGQDKSQSTYSYTALEDSYVVGWIEVINISGCEIYLNGVQIGRNTENGSTWSGSSICYLLRTGDKIEFKNFGVNVEGHIKAYSTK